MDFHPVADIFPLMGEVELGELAEDIRENGLLEPIWVYCSGDSEERIIDGRNRYLACERVGVVPAFRRYSGVDSGLVAFVLSLNLRRRHLSESQRAMVAARVSNLSDGQRKAGSPIGEATTQGEAAELLNVGKRTVERARRVQERGAPELVEAVESGALAVSTAADVATLPAAEQSVVVARGEKAILAEAKRIRAVRAEERRGRRMAEIAEKCAVGTPELPMSSYAVVLADPPWRYEYSVSTSREIENQYPTMALDEICALPVANIACEDCVLFIWATSPKLTEALRVMESWGFEYRTCMVWVKDKIGMGYYARQRHELLLIGKRGQPPAPEPAARPDSVIEAPRGNHSAKPECVHWLIESMYPAVPRVELFGRKEVHGWTMWGNQP